MAPLTHPVPAVMRLDHRDPPTPRDRRIHRVQEPFTARDPPPVAVLKISKAGLLINHNPITAAAPAPTPHATPTTEKISESLDYKLERLMPVTTASRSPGRAV